MTESSDRQQGSNISDKSRRDRMDSAGSLQVPEIANEKFLPGGVPGIPQKIREFDRCPSGAPAKISAREPLDFTADEMLADSDELCRAMIADVGECYRVAELERLQASFGIEPSKNNFENNSGEPDAAVFVVIVKRN